ncbi:LWR-salt protein [Halegenticoccus tardaugens]|uniref:LWR-salt protein n=1 Tax=Halegenticoccus tardaugens TaxID=2071624 RepID=UPI00100A8F61|nr:LWR-salt protein [Halegenticoccus tardaugens]
MDAAYVFRVRFRLAPAGGARVEPREFETVLRLPAAASGEEGWLFFRDSLWRGDANDERHLRERFEDVLGVPVSGVAFRELETDEAYLDALKAEIGADLGRFNADDVAEALHKYLGSSVRVRSN